MRYATLNEIKTQKHYTRDQFYKVTHALQYSLALTYVLLLACVFFYLRWPPQTFYASNAEYAGFVIELTPLSHPNYSSTALLEPSLPSEVQVKGLDFNLTSPTPTRTQ